MSREKSCGGGQVPEFWPQPSAASQRAGGRQLERKVGRRKDEDKKAQARKGKR